MRNERLKVAVLGAGGLAGGELLRLLTLHPNISSIVAASKSQAGKMVHNSHPALRHLKHFSFVDMRTAMESECDVVFCAMPHGKSMHIMQSLIDKPYSCIVDLAGDFRLSDQRVFEDYYCPHSCFDLCSDFQYGLPEANREAIRTSRLIANPGCFATAAQLLLLPLASIGLLPAGLPVFAVTGSSGSGIIPKAGTHHPHRDGNFYAYKLDGHQHDPEIEETLAAAAKHKTKIRLLPHSGPFIRGIHVSSFFRMAEGNVTDINDLYAKYYRGHPFVSILDAPPQVAEVAASNFVHIHTAQNRDEVALTLALDNLVKGAAGQAIQNMNLSLGLPEEAGLTHPGAFPC